VDGDNLSTSKYSYSPPRLSSPTTSNLAALLQHHHPAVAMVEKDSRLSTFQVLCRYLHAVSMVVALLVLSRCGRYVTNGWVLLCF